MNRPRFAAVILAAGEGTRLKSARPKVLHEIAGSPMIRHVIDALRPLKPAETVIVRGRKSDSVARAVAPLPSVIQSPPRGTGDAVRAARSRPGWVTSPTSSSCSATPRCCAPKPSPR